MHHKRCNVAFVLELLQIQIRVIKAQLWAYTTLTTSWQSICTSKSLGIVQPLWKVLQIQKGSRKIANGFSESAHCSTNYVVLLSSCKSGLQEFELERTMRDVIDLA